MRRFVPAFMIQLPATFQVELDAIRMFAARPLMFEVVNVPPLKLKTELVGEPQARLVASSVLTVIAPPDSSVFVPASPTVAPMFSIPFGEKMEPPLVTTSVPALMIVLLV